MQGRAAGRIWQVEAVGLLWMLLLLPLLLAAGVLLRQAALIGPSGCRWRGSCHASRGSDWQQQFQQI